MKNHDSDEGNSGNAGSDVCPVSGLKITCKPEWINIPLTDEYTVTFQFIGERIIRSMPHGEADLEGIAALFRERDKVIRQMLGDGEKCVELRDFAGVRNRPGRKVRNQMVEELRKSGNMLIGWINFNLPTPMKILVKVGTQIYRFPFHVSVAVDYKDAVNQALKLIDSKISGQSSTEAVYTPIQTELDGPVEPYIDELVRYISSINWEVGAIDINAAKRDEHPFKPVYDAIDLVKMDLEDLLQEREKSTRALLQQETEQRSIIESIEDGYYECDLAGNILVANEAFNKICGFKPETVIGVNYQETMDEANVITVFEAFNRVYRTGNPCQNIAYEVYGKAGARCPVEVSASLVRDRAGKPTGFRGIVRDMTGHRKKEAELMMFRRFVEASGEGMSWSDLDGRVVYANDTMCRILGETDLASTRGKRVTGYYNSNVRKTLIHEIRPVIMKGGEWKGELLLRRQNGEKISTLNDIFLIRDEAGQPLYHAIISRDISDLKKVEQALRENEERYRILYEHAGDAIFVAQDGIAKFPNLKGQALFGFSREELANRSFLEVIHPADQGMVLERHQKRLKGEKFDQTYSFRIFNKAGKMIWVQITSVYLEWEGRPAALVFLRDITRQVSMEEQLRQKYKMEAVGTLAGGIAHDFNNILAGIMGYTDVISGGTPEGTTAHKNLNQIRKSVMRARGLVKQLLAFSRSAEQDYSPVNMGMVVKEVLEMVRTMSPPSVDIVDSIQSGNCRIFANPVQVHAITLNLCKNALQAMPDGGTLEVSLQSIIDPETGLIDEPLEPGRYCQLIVRDTGEGMKSEDRKRIFEPYFTTRPQGQGTGLGLSVVHGVVANLGGIITVGSKLEKGSTFTIFFPLIESDESPRHDMES